MKPFVVGIEQIQSLKALAQYAKENPLSIDDNLDQMNGDRLAPGLMAKYQCSIPVGYKVVFTFEKNNLNQDIRRMSISTSTPGQHPSPATVAMVIKLLGFENNLEDCLVRIEALEDGQSAICVAELITF